MEQPPDNRDIELHGFEAENFENIEILAADIQDEAEQVAQSAEELAGKSIEVSETDQEDLRRKIQRLNRLVNIILSIGLGYGAGATVLVGALSRHRDPSLGPLMGTYLVGAVAAIKLASKAVLNLYEKKQSSNG